MQCCKSKEQENKIDVRLEFRREELLYDICNYTHIEGSILPSETEPHQRHTIQDIADEGNVDRVTRVLDLVHAGITELLYPYTKRVVAEKVLNDGLVETDVYVIEMSVPQSFSQTTLQWLEKLVHEWMVYRVVADWLSITNPSKAVIWAQKAEQTESEIRGCLNTRRGRGRIKLHPF